MQLWQLHNAEQMIMDDMEANPDKYKDKKLSELTDDDDDDYTGENSVEYTKAYYKKSLIPKMILVSSLLITSYGECAIIWFLVCFGRKQALKNSTWKLRLLSVRFTPPLMFISLHLRLLGCYTEAFYISPLFDDYLWEGQVPYVGVSYVWLWNHINWYQ